MASTPSSRVRSYSVERKVSALRAPSAPSASITFRPGNPAPPLTEIRVLRGGEEGVTASDAEIETAMGREASRPELRKTYAVFVRPEVDAGQDFPTPEQAAAARTTAERALAGLKGGADFGAVAAKYSTDISKDDPNNRTRKILLSKAVLRILRILRTHSSRDSRWYPARLTGSFRPSRRIAIRLSLA